MVKLEQNGAKIQKLDSWIWAQSNFNDITSFKLRFKMLLKSETIGRYRVKNALIEAFKKGN